MFVIFIVFEMFFKIFVMLFFIFVVSFAIEIVIIHYYPEFSMSLFFSTVIIRVFIFILCSYVHFILSLFFFLGYGSEHGHRVRYLRCAHQQGRAPHEQSRRQHDHVQQSAVRCVSNRLPQYNGQHPLRFIQLSLVLLFCHSRTKFI